MMDENALEQAVFIDRIATIIHQHGWQFPAQLALESGRPLTVVGGQLMWVMQPFLSLFITTETVRQTAQLLEDSAAIDALLARLQMDDM